MKPFQRGAVLVPVTVTQAGIEVYATRRAYWNPQKRRPMTFPGEIVFAGGLEEEEDVADLEDEVQANIKTRINNAINEFRQETGYGGEIRNPQLLFEYTTEHPWAIHHVGVVVAQIDYYGPFPGSKEVVGGGWGTIDGLMQLVNAKAFTKEQEWMLQHARYENQPLVADQLSAKRTQFPYNTIRILQAVRDTFNQESDSLFARVHQ